MDGPAGGVIAGGESSREVVETVKSEGDADGDNAGDPAMSRAWGLEGLPTCRGAGP